MLLPESLESLPAIKISFSGDSSYVPSKTKRQPATQVKRAPTAANTDDKYKKDGNPSLGSERNEVSGKSFPDHYLIIAGRVTQRPEGNTIILKFDSACYDIQLEHDKKIVFTDRSEDTWYSWDKANYEVLGHIKLGLTYVEIERDRRGFAAEMNKK
ncbi:hypothetical protein COH21_007065 [Aspergillus flavus]|nr:hypothetical protein COH21_007065 [Aspergillus flavus]